MPIKLPDLQTFASPVQVAGPRPIASYDLSPLARGNAAIMQGTETIGKGIQAIGQDVSDVDENEKRANDRYQLAIANASFNVDHTTINSGLEHDQNYPTLQDRYEDQANDAQDKWAATITDPRQRSLFVAQTDGSIAAGSAAIKQRAWTLEGQTKMADIDDRGKSLSDGAIADPMNEGTFGTALDQYGAMVDSMVAKGFLTPTQGAAKKDTWAHSAGVGVGLARADIDPTGALNEVRAMPGSPEQIDNRILQIEGPGKDPRSSAVGGFIDSTWTELVRSQRPDLAQGKSDADILALRADPGLRKDMTEAYRVQNSAYLQGQGIEATPGNQYLAHFLGPAGAAAVLKANPNAPVGDVLASAVGPAKAQAMIDANPSVLQGKLAGTVSQWANGRMGGAIPGDGHIYDWLDDNQRRQIAGYAQNKLEALQLDQNSTLKQRIEDTAAEAARSGYATNPVTQSEFVSAKGLIEGPKLYQQYQAGLKAAADISNISRMTEAQQNELLKSYEPQPGEGYEAASERQAAVLKQIQTVRKERDEDPAKFAINRIPAVKAAFDSFQQIAADPSATPDAKAMAARDYVNKTTERQIASGVAPEDIAIVPKSYSDKLDKAFTAAATSTDATARVGLIARIGQEKALWGDDVWPDLVRQLPPTTQPVVRAIAAGADPVAMTRLLSLGKDENPAALLKEQNETTSRNMNAALNTSFAPLLSTMVGAQRDRDYKSYADLGQKLAALYVRDGQKAEVAADNAFNALVGDRYDFRDTYRIPKDPHIDPDAVQLGAQIARGQIISSAPDNDLAGFRSNLTAADRDLGLTPEEKALYSRHLVNLTGAGGVDNADGSRSSLYQAVQPHDVTTTLPDGLSVTQPRYYNIPTVWNGKIETEKWTRPSDGKVFDVPNKTALANVEKEGWEKFPSYATPDEADKRYDAMHGFMEKDTAQYMALKKAGAVARSGPFADLRPQINDMGLSGNDADSRANFARDGIFVTSPRNDGLNIAYGNSFLSNKAGQRILLTWDQLGRLGDSKEAQAAFVGSLRDAGAGPM